MSSFSTLAKPLWLTSDLGDDLLFLRLKAHEALSQLYAFEVHALFDGLGDKPAKLIGTTASVGIQCSDGERHLHGLIAEVGPTGEPAQGLTPWRLVLRPTMWMLTLREDSRIFQAKNVKDILLQVFDRYGLDVEWQLRGTYPPREYCVQYRESDFNFASRLMEQEGIGYFFRHAKDRHTLVIFDNPGAHPKCPVQHRFRIDDTQAAVMDDDSIAQWRACRRVGTGQVVLADYDWKKPATVLRSTIKAAEVSQPVRLEQYDYAVHYTEPAEGQRYAQVRLQEASAPLQQAEGSGALRTLAAGHKFELTMHWNNAQQGEHVVVQTEIEATVSGYYAEEAAASTFTCRFIAMPAAVPWRPPRTARRTRMEGPQTARVVGPGGEEIFTDEQGRVKLHFHWDRLGQADENSSCWVRVATPWAGAMRGWVSVPRIGDEVVVDFLEGDPDRPLVTGSVYNGTQPPPWQLPANKTQSGLLTRSSPGGTGETNANVLRFEDKKGEEEIWLHAEKNQLIEVENNEHHSVGNDRTKSIGHDETTDVGRNRTETVGKDETITIGENRTESVGKNESITIGDKRTKDVGGDEITSIGKNRTETVADNERVDVGKNRDTTVGKNEQHDVGENRTTSIGKDDKMQVGKKWVVQAGDEISFVTGSASITMKKDGTIQIKGKDITITGSGKINVKASSDVVIKGSKIAQN